MFTQDALKPPCLMICYISEEDPETEQVWTVNQATQLIWLSRKPGRKVP